jgi:hypothetical protein
MSVLGTISKPAPRPPIITICGDAGTGKTSLAATFPNPIFIRAEDGIGRIQKGIAVPDAFPTVQNADGVFEQLLALLQEDHSYSTLVIDSVTKLEELFTRDILERDGRAKTLSTAMGGYGAGYQALAAMHGRVRKAAGLLNERKSMAIVFIAHADLETMRLPDTDDYQRYSLRLNSKSISHYVDDVDLVGYVRLQSVLRGEDGDRKKVISNGDREFVCHATAASVSKNGFGITEPIDFEPGKNPLADALGITARAAKAPAKKKPETTDKTQDETQGENA